MINKKILLTGGSGLIGQYLTKLLLAKGYQVAHLSRKPGNNAAVKTYLWDVAKGDIDDKCLDGVDIVIHLAGAGIAEKRWTDARKRELIDSRTKSIKLIYDLMKQKPHQVSAIISASATGYYSNSGDKLMIETDQPQHDFLSECCIKWEQAVDEGMPLVHRVLKFRTGVVLTNSGGALPQLATPIKFGVGSPIGNGKQWIPWIHWLDVADMYLYGIENAELSGVYNMVSPNPVTNQQLTKAVAQQLHRPLWAPKVPAFMLKLLLGEMSLVVLCSTKVSAQKIEKAGFQFKYPDIKEALMQIYKG